MRTTLHSLCFSACARRERSLEPSKPRRRGKTTALEIEAARSLASEQVRGRVRGRLGCAELRGELAPPPAGRPAAASPSPAEQALLLVTWKMIP